jgi:hypothetical protein
MLKEKLMKKLIALFCITLLSFALHAENEIPQNASEAFERHKATISTFMHKNERELKHADKIAGNVAKIVGGFITVHGYYKFLIDIGRHMSIEKNKYGAQFRVTNPATMEASLWNLWICQHYTDINNNPATAIQHINRPPYFSALAITLYLFASGTYGIYKEVLQIIAEQNDAKNSQPSH